MCLGLAAEPWIESPPGTTPFDSKLLEIQAMIGKDFYVYVHYRATDSTPFYVGKGSGNRHEAKAGRNIFWHRVVTKHGYYSEIIYSDLYQKQAYALETETIKDFKIHGFLLTNLTCGSDGGFGLESQALVSTMSQKRIEGCKKAGEKRKGIKRPPHVIEKMRMANIGKKHSFSSRLKRSMEMQDEGHHLYNETLHDFVNIETGEEVTKTMHRLSKDRGVSKPNLYKMIHGEILTSENWTIKGRDISRARKANIERVFYHDDYGYENCTMTDLKNKYGMPLGNLSKIISGERKSCHGWTFIGPSVTAIKCYLLTRTIKSTECTAPAILTAPLKTGLSLASREF